MESSRSTSNSCGLAALRGSRGQRVFVGFGPPAPPIHGYFGLMDREGGRFLPRLSVIEADFPDVAYSDENDDAAFVLLRGTARLLRVRSTE